MNTMQNRSAIAGYLWRVPLCGLAYVAGTVVAGAGVSALGLPLPQLPEQADARTMGMLLLVASCALAAGLSPLARRLSGPYWLRWLVLAVLCYLCIGVTSPLEGAVFTTMDMASIPALSLPPCLLFAAAVALLFKPIQSGGSLAVSAQQFFRGRTARQWLWRLVAAVFAFPLVYWTFGLMVAPFVMEYYKQGQFSLAVPNPVVILATQFARSVLFLLAAMPILILWSGSRRQLVMALGLAFYVLVGLFGMLQSYWLAPTLQILHNTEIFVDSMVYALALAVLLVHPEETKADRLFARYLLCMAQTPVAD
ncbi:MAG: hypothetical protein JW955_03090 [Sedimentisphaerales bacterium]|nr:hypothetical protein [Sedimentisphaerales bacterium]